MNIYLKYIKRYLAPFVVAMLCVGCEAVCDLLGPTLMSVIIDNGIKNGDIMGVISWGGLMLLVTAIGAAFAITRNKLASRVSQRMGADLRYDLFAKILRFSEGAVDKLESGSLITRMTNDTSQVTQFVNGMMRIFVKAPITCIGSIVLASIMNLQLSLIIYGVVAIIFLLIFLSMKLSYPRFSLLQKATDKVNSVVQEYLIGVRLVKAFGTYGLEEERFDTANSALRKAGVSSQMIITIATPLMTITVGIGSALAIYFGSLLFKNQLIQPGDISAFTIYMAQMLGSLMMLTNIFNAFVRTKASTVRINEVLQSEEDFSDSKGGLELLPAASLEFREVTFVYPGAEPLIAAAKPSEKPIKAALSFKREAALHGVSFFVPAGKTLAVIGATGSGKSTLCWLVARFYEASSGSILIDGKDIKEMPIKWVRDSVAIVPQRSMLFTDTIENNLRWGSPNASDADMEKAISVAQADFIKAMPDGLSSQLQAGAVNLSGGQKQRISIARGVLKRAPILLLDDATSALDAITEAKVWRSLNGRCEQEKSTIVAVTQRCSTAMNADVILVLENGKAVGFGCHSELLAACPTYLHIYRSQIDSSAKPLPSGDKSHNTNTKH